MVRFTAGLGTPYRLWQDWGALSGVERVVAARVLAGNPHNTEPASQPHRYGVGALDAALGVNTP